MSSIKEAKNALVAALFELSKSANEAADATVSFYRLAGFEAGEAAGLALANLSETIANGAAGFSLGSNGADVTLSQASQPLEDGADSAKTRKKRARKDPLAPKKPLTTYLRYNLQVRDEIKKERSDAEQPPIPAIELNKIIAERWGSLGESEKNKLQSAYDADFEVYKKELESYKAKEKGEGGEAAATAAPVSPVATASSAPAVTETPTASQASPSKKSSVKSADGGNADTLSTIRKLASSPTKETQKKKAPKELKDVSTPKKEKAKKKKEPTSDDKKLKKRKSE